METNPVKVIRLHCLDCAYSPKEVELCPCTKCNLWPWRFGKNPYRKKPVLSEEERERRRNVAFANLTKIPDKFPGEKT